MSDDTGLALVALFYALCAAAVILEAVAILYDCLVAAAAQGHIQRFLGEVVQFHKAAAADANADAQGHREIRVRFDLSGFVEDRESRFHQLLIAAVCDDHLIQIFLVPHDHGLHFGCPVTQEAVDARGDPTLISVVAGCQFVKIVHVDEH